MNREERTVRVEKVKLIKQIKDNKDIHIKEYDEAVIAYKKEALKQLGELETKANDGDMTLHLKLVTPINNSEKYDKILSQFEWEVKDIVELSQSEFNKYILDDTEFSRSAKFSNMSYMG